MEYQKTVLPNGLRIVTENVPGFRSVTVGLWVEVGSRYELEDHSGISHLLEHMVFKGTAHRSSKDIVSSIESLGGSINAFTAREQTCYYVRILDKHLPVAVSVLADMLTRPKLRQPDLAREKNVICEEIRDVNDTPSELLHDLFCGDLWVDHPIGQPIMGCEKSVSGIKRRDLKRHHQSHYTPDNVLVAASGHVNHRRLVRLVRQAFDQCAGTANGNSLPAPDNASDRHGVYQRDLNQVHVCMGVRAIPFLDKRRYALLLLNDLLGGGMSSRLFQSVRERHGLVYSIYSFHDFFKDTGVFGTFFGTGPRRVEEAIDVVFKEFRRVKRRSVDSRILHDIKNQIKGQLVLGLESSSNRMHRLARHELFTGKYQSVTQTMRAIDRITAKDIRDLAHDILTEDRLRISMIGPVDRDTIAHLDWAALG